jgi:hypothetical protein
MGFEADDAGLSDNSIMDNTGGQIKAVAWV